MHSGIKIIIFVIIYLLIAAQITLANSLASIVKGLPADYPHNQNIPVVVKLNSDINLDFLRSKVQGHTREVRKQIVWQEVSSFADESQKNLLNFLNEYEKSNRSNLNIKSLKISNTIKLNAPPDLITRLATHKDAAFIMYANNPAILENQINASNYSLDQNFVDELDEISWNVEHVQAPQVWELGYTGEGILVAVIDTGVKYDHPDLENNMWDGGEEYPFHGWNFSDDNNDPMDISGHGTGVAGIVAGDGSAGQQTGVAPGATIMALKVSNSAQCWQAHDFALEHGADITTMSMGFFPVTPERRPTWRHSLDILNIAGITNIKSAGNRREEFEAPHCITMPGGVPSPWRHPDEIEEGGRGGLISVAALTPENEYTYFSSFGPVTWQDVPEYNDYLLDETHVGMIAPDIAAPGINGVTLSIYLNYRDDFGGTSMAAPHVAGVVALMLSKNPNLTTIAIDSILQSTAFDLGPFGKDNDYGSGLVQAFLAANSIDAATGSLQGIVYDSNTNLPLEGVDVRWRFTNVSSTTNSYGEYSLSLITGLHQVAVNHLPYHENVHTVQIDSAQVTEQDIYLEVGLFTPSQDEIIVELVENSNLVRYLWVYNRGSENLDVIFKGYPQTNLDDYFDILFEFEVGEITGDLSIKGMAYIDSLLYVCGSNNTVNPNKIYVFDLTGDLIETYNQPGNNSDNGWYDLTTDGQYIYAGELNDIVVVDPVDFSEINRFDGPYYPVSALDYDFENGWLWIGNVYQDLVAIDPATGEEITRIDLDYRVRSIEYVPEDEDNLPLYLNVELIEDFSFHYRLVKTDSEGSQFIEISDLSEYGPEYFYDIEVIKDESLYYDMFLTLEHQDDGFWIRGREQEVNLYWLSIDQDTVSIAPQDSHQVVLTFQSNRILEDNPRGIILADHNGYNGQDIINVGINVVENSTKDFLSDLPQDFSFQTPYPNPFNSSTKIIFELPSPDNVKIMIYDIMGREVAAIADGKFAAGKHLQLLDGKNLASGIYFVRMKTESGFAATKKLLLIK